MSLPADQPDRAAALQVASADAPGLIVDGTTPPAASSAPFSNKTDARMPFDTGPAHVSATPANSSDDAPSRETAQTSTDNLSSAASDMADTMNVASTASIPVQDSDRIDLNTASFEQLNALRNAGPLARAIIKGRPYASVDDLVKRKVIRRSVYEKIKDQVAVR